MVNLKTQELSQKRRKSKGVYAVFDDNCIDELNNYGEPKHLYFKAMCSIWMKTVPPDLQDNWLFKLCPVGKRTIVVASKNSTRVYNKRGIARNYFQSALPGGNVSFNGQKYSVLDCIHNPKTNVFYILDVMAWNNCAVTKCSTNVRFFFIESRFEETPEIKTITSKNAAKFFLLPKYQCKLDTIQRLLSEATFNLNGSEFNIDGILFFNKDARYMRQESSLVRWAKPYMIPELLLVPVCEKFFEERPKSYTNVIDFVIQDQQRIQNIKQGIAPPIESYSEPFYNNRKSKFQFNNPEVNPRKLYNKYEDNNYRPYQYENNFYHNKREDRHRRNNYRNNYNDYSDNFNEMYAGPYSEENTNNKYADSRNNTTAISNAIDMPSTSHQPTIIAKKEESNETKKPINTVEQTHAKSKKEEEKENISQQLKKSIIKSQLATPTETNQSPFFNKDFDAIEETASATSQNIEDILEKSQFYIKGKGPIAFNEFKPRNQISYLESSFSRSNSQNSFESSSRPNSQHSFASSSRPNSQHSFISERTSYSKFSSRYTPDSGFSSRCQSSNSSSYHRYSDGYSSGYDNFQDDKSTYSESYYSDYSKSRNSNRKWDEATNADNNSVSSQMEQEDYNSFQPFSHLKDYTEHDENAVTFESKYEPGNYESNFNNSFDKFDMMNNDFFKPDNASSHQNNAGCLENQNTSPKNNVFDYNALQCYMDEQTALAYPKTPEKLQKDKKRQFFDELYFSKCAQNIKTNLASAEENFSEVSMDLTYTSRDNDSESFMDLTLGYTSQIQHTHSKTPDGFQENKEHQQFHKLSFTNTSSYTQNMRRSASVTPLHDNLNTVAMDLTPNTSNNDNLPLNESSMDLTPGVSRWNSFDRQ